MKSKKWVTRTRHRGWETSVRIELEVSSPLAVPRGEKQPRRASLAQAER